LLARKASRNLAFVGVGDVRGHLLASIIVRRIMPPAPAPQSTHMGNVPSPRGRRERPQMADGCRRQLANGVLLCAS